MIIINSTFRFTGIKNLHRSSKMNAATAIKMLSSPFQQNQSPHSPILSYQSSCFSSEIRFLPALLSSRNLGSGSISICKRTIMINSSGAISSVAMAKMESSFKQEEARIPPAIPLSVSPITKVMFLFHSCIFCVYYLCSL